MLATILFCLLFAVDPKVPERLLTDLAFVEFLDSFGHFLTKKSGGISTKVYSPRFFGSEIDSKEPKNRLKTNSLTVSETSRDAARKEIEQIDGQIQKLEVQRDAYFNAADQYQKEGDNWQYRTGYIQDAYKNWGKADEMRQKGFEIQSEIDQLNDRKNRIYTRYPSLEYP